MMNIPSTDRKRTLKLSNLSWTEAEERIKTVKTAVIPLGATEQHGPYLPIGTDAYIASSLTDLLETELGFDYPVLFLPVLPIGKSPEHLDFCGTLSLRMSTLLAVIDDICSCLKRHGFENVVFLNTHGGNTDFLKAVLYDIQEKYGLHSYCIYTGGSDGWDSGKTVEKYFPKACFAECHAGSVESSIICYLYPNLLPEGTLCTTEQKTVLLPIWFGWKTKDVSENGVIGDPRFYSSVAGKEILHEAVIRIHKILDIIVETGNQD